AVDRPDGRIVTAGDRTLGDARGLDAAALAPPPGIRPGDLLRPLRGDARGRNGPDHLLQRGDRDPEGDPVVATEFDTCMRPAGDVTIHGLTHGEVVDPGPLLARESIGPVFRTLHPHHPNHNGNDDRVGIAFIRLTTVAMRPWPSAPGNRAIVVDRGVRRPPSRRSAPGDAGPGGPLR